MDMMKKRFSIVFVATLFLVALFIGAQINSVVSGDGVFEQLKKFQDVLGLADKYYVDTVNSEKLTVAAINGLLGTLDPHSIYLPPAEVSSEKELFQGSF